MALDKNGKPLPKGISWREKEKRYMGRFQYEGKTYTIYNSNKTAIIKELENLKYEIIHGLKGKADKVTLNMWFDTWLNVYKKNSIKPTSYRNYENLYKNSIRDAIGHRQLDLIKPLHIQKLYTELLLERNISTRHLRNINSMLYNIFKIAIQNNLIVRNPCEGVSMPKLEQPEMRVLSTEEQQIFIEYVRSERWRYYEPLFIVMLGTGMRCGEALGLSWDDIDFEHKEIHINHTLVYIKEPDSDIYKFSLQTPKTKSSRRTIPMNDDVFKALKIQHSNTLKMRLFMGADWKALEGFENTVFVNYYGRPMQPSEITNMLKKIVAYINQEEKAKADKNGSEPFVMEDFHAHTLRHTFATRCFELGIDGKTVQTYLGHSSIKMTLDLYTHVMPNKLHDDMQKVSVMNPQIKYG
ncbi:MAG: site-specific integrase [Lachnospiraceae bacterium]|nr:site-specific integrase [Lachnospiraceae bacterium]